MGKGKEKDRDEQEEKSEKELNEERLVKEFFKAMGLKPNEVMRKVRALLKEALGEDDPSDAELAKALDALHSSGKLDGFLRNVGLVPKPNFASALFGWHDIEHMRAKGFSNKVAGLSSLTARLAALALASWEGYKYFSR